MCHETFVTRLRAAVDGHSAFYVFNFVRMTCSRQIDVQIHNPGGPLNNPPYWRSLQSLISHDRSNTQLRCADSKVWHLVILLTLLRMSRFRKMRQILYHRYISKNSGFVMGLTKFGRRMRCFSVTATSAHLPKH